MLRRLLPLATRLPLGVRMNSTAADSYSKGLAGVIAGKSSISTVGLKGTGLTYRGYAIEDLCSQCTFEEVAYLLLFKELPTRTQLHSFQDTIAANRALPVPLRTVLEQLPRDAHPMDVLRTGCSTLGTFEPETHPNEQQVNIAIRLISCYASMLFYWYHFSHFGKRIDTGTSKKDSVAEHFLHLLHDDPKKIDPLCARTVDASLILYAEHDFNASTFAARVTCATLSDFYSCITSAIGTLRGPLHGGANEAAMHMLEGFKDEMDARQQLEQMFARKELVMGFGHR
mmetsp:Transcript_11344/g.32886  ORF Transcript_11344/g.32886 Transcript_11344/m.32886 type:complete len:285 (-) Transcript_11344:4640-5494(-)